ncbi:DUF3822 family protein [Mucilaginibacter segetis]|uniref:DUF3822 family protein n=1 Tax=Mucilaginibacter segetis TaxID=2793071 RepID=A0A934ULT8_9SPHI|nr:DUF3822 family protein [Mucilaginibacter segetis]MBK0378938.1 DUF3822 family protein [Mucilaginibacter segetis]
MSEHSFKYTDEELNLDQAHHYTLLLQLNAQSFSYAIIFEKKLLAWAENCPPEELKNPQEYKDILTADYKKVITGLPTTGFTLLPTTLFDDTRVADMARLLDVKETEKVYAQSLDNENFIIYKVDEALVPNGEYFDISNTVYQGKGWINLIAANNSGNNNLYVNMDEGVAEFLFFKENKLRFYNFFSYTNSEELAYYSAFVAEELSLNMKQTNLILSGDINATDSSFTYLEKFFGTVKLNDIYPLEMPEQVVPHKLLTLAALSLCASSEEN